MNLLILLRKMVKKVFSEELIKGNMRTIKKSLLDIIELQASEAEVQGLTKIASDLTNQVVKNADAVRDDDEFYIYSNEDYKNDIRDQLWNTVIRTADYFNQSFDAQDFDPIIERYASLLMSDLRAKFGSEHGVGAHESNVPGQSLEKITIEVE